MSARQILWNVDDWLHRHPVMPWWLHRPLCDWVDTRLLAEQLPDTDVIVGERGSE